MEDNRCLVCADSISATKLGIDACRACADFFIRTKIAGRQFTCRQGSNNCVITKDDKFTCRRCRFDRCVEAGMSYDLPQRRKPKRKVLRSSSLDNQASSSKDHRQGSLIDAMGREYKASCERRLIQEKEYVAKHNLQMFPHPTEKLYAANFVPLYELFRIAVKESTSLLQNVFSDFGCFPINHQGSPFKNFITKFSMIECVYLSKKYFKDGSVFMASLITCADINNSEQWVHCDSIVDRKEDFQTSVKGFTNEHSEIFYPMSRMNDLTEREFYVLAILNYCDVDLSRELPDEIIERAQIIRARMFEELQNYYRKVMKLSDFSKRIGKLMALAHGARETFFKMCEELRMYATMFDLYSDDRLFRELFAE
ncbi:hypothetical protein PMAYCL1PPCAC_21197, partial [Pristionchus mayeri]